MKILDWYILKRYLLTFFAMILMFIPISILVDFAEKMEKILSRAPLNETIYYYLNFIVYFSNSLFPIFLFLSVIWFTSILANKTEIVAMLSSGISYNRFLRPYFYGATLLSLLSFSMSMFLVPYSSGVYLSYVNKYLRSEENSGTKIESYYNQVSEDQVVFVGTYDNLEKKGTDFYLEKFEDLKLKTKISASRIEYIDSMKIYRLYDYSRRDVGEFDDKMKKSSVKDTLFSFSTDDLIPIDYVAETKNLFELDKFIDLERKKGSANVKLYEIVYYKRWSFIFTAYILTFIGVAVSSVKKRGGMGVNLLFGILLGLSYVFLDRLFSTMTEKSGMSAFWSVAIPNIVFLILAVYLIRKARR